MENGVQMMLQGGALGLLAYLIYWMTQSGAPKLFDRLGGIQVAIESHSNRLLNLERIVEELRNEIRQKVPRDGG
jgi:hypothetical protein